MGAAGNRRQTAERSLEQFAYELRLSVVERDAVRTTGALARTLSDPLVGRRRHVGRAAAERRRPGDRDDFVEMDDLRSRTLLRLRELEQLQQKQTDTARSHVAFPTLLAVRCMHVVLCCRQLHRP